jgi:ribose transport system permease protein
MIILGPYVVEMLLVGIGGILFAFYTNSISPANHGSSYELYAIAAAVLGGCSLRGGEGSILGIVIGTASFRYFKILSTRWAFPVR